MTPGVASHRVEYKGVGVDLGFVINWKRGAV